VVPGSELERLDDAFRAIGERIRRDGDSMISGAACDPALPPASGDPA